MKDRFFLDTNIILYSLDHTSAKKQKRAQLLIENALSKGNGFISTQIVQETLNALLRKGASTAKPEDAKLLLEQILLPLCRKYTHNVSIYSEALKLQERWRYSFYDSLVIAAATQLECKILYSEDMQHNQRLPLLQIINPFV